MDTSNAETVEPDSEKTLNLSVVIPCFNAADTLGEQLEALASQDYSGDWEIVIADNRSTDEPEKVVAQYADRFDHLSMVPATEGRGCAYARNVGAQHSRGESLLFCDADDVVSSDWLSNMADGLKDNDFVTGPTESSVINPGIAKTKRRNNVRVWGYLPFLPHAIGGNMGIKTHLHRAIGGFDETLLSAEDVDYSWRLKLDHDVDPIFLPDAFIYYRMRPSHWGAFRQNMHNGRYTVMLYKKYLDSGLVPRKSIKEGLRGWRRLLTELTKASSPDLRARWVRQFGHAMGRLVGSIRYRVVAL